MFHHIYNHKLSQKLDNEKCIPQVYRLNNFNKNQVYPATVDLRVLFNTNNVLVLNQESLGACVANAFSNNMKFLFSQEKINIYQPSRLYLYFMSRVMIDGSSKNDDTGTQLSSMIQAINEYGSCNEISMPYNISTFTTSPNQVQLTQAFQNSKVTYTSVAQNLQSIKNCLCNKLPVTIGINVYDSFESDSVSKTGIVPMPNVATENLLGGHCVLIVGYNATQFICMNSWGVTWGSSGYFYLPIAYVLSPSLTSELFCIQFVN
jgi:C1A family cysteine protease